jgi:hypothetical protein
MLGELFVFDAIDNGATGGWWNRYHRLWSCREWVGD